MKKRLENFKREFRELLGSLSVDELAKNANIAKRSERILALIGRLEGRLA